MIIGNIKVGQFGGEVELLGGEVELLGGEASPATSSLDETLRMAV